MIRLRAKINKSNSLLLGVNIALSELFEKSKQGETKSNTLSLFSSLSYLHSLDCRLFFFFTCAHPTCAYPTRGWTWARSRRDIWGEIAHPPSGPIESQTKSNRTVLSIQRRSRPCLARAPSSLGASLDILSLHTPYCHSAIRDSVFLFPPITAFSFFLYLDPCHNPKSQGLKADAP